MSLLQKAFKVICCW